MFLHKCCIFYFVIAVSGMNHVTDKLLPNNTVHKDENNDFDFPCVQESTSQQPNTSTNQEPEPLSLNEIITKFVQQYRKGITEANRWYDLEKNTNDSKWDNLCDQTWHNKGRQNYTDINCTGQQIMAKSNYRVRMRRFRYIANFLKCSCPAIRNHKHYQSTTNADRFFFVARHTDTNYFTLINIEQFVLIIHGYVMNLPKSPFTEILDTTRKYYYTDEAREIFKRRKFFKSKSLVKDKTVSLLNP